MTAACTAMRGQYQRAVRVQRPEIPISWLLEDVPAFAELVSGGPRPWPASWQVTGNRQVIRRRKGTAVSNTIEGTAAVPSLTRRRVSLPGLVR